MKYLKLGLIIIFASCLIFLLNRGVKTTAIRQAKLSRDAVKLCINKLQPHTKEQLRNALDTCATGSRALGATGDVFCIRQDDKLLVWDNSKDCKLDRNDKQFLTKESTCKLFHMPTSCVDATNVMVNTDHGITNWKFDDAEEYIAFYSLKIGNVKYVVGQGVQLDEAGACFNTLYEVVIISGILAVMGVLLGCQRN